MNRAVFLDRDGTINIDYGYVYKISDFEFINRAKEGLKMLQEAGYLLIVVTNQSGIGRGFFSVDDFDRLNQHIDLELSRDSISLTDTLFCPHIDEDNCNCRKPKLALYYRATRKYDIDLSQSFAIGDSLRDLYLGNVEPVKCILLIDNKIDTNLNDIFFAKNLYHAAKIIISTN